MKISVVMPVYNAKEEYLREAIESILNQTYTDFEFIIVNDGSTNNSEEVILSYKDKRIVYLKQDNQGVAKSLNNGIDIAQGEYIARMDSDDISLPERFAKQVKFLDEHPEISILGSWYETLPGKKTIKAKANPKYMDFIASNFICHPSIMMRKADLDNHNLRYDPEYKSEDYDLWSRAVKNMNIYILQEVLVRYRWHEGNLSREEGVYAESDRKIRERMLGDLTENKNLQNQLLFLSATQNINFKPMERIFSMKNFKIAEKKYKAITILGMSIYR